MSNIFNATYEIDDVYAGGYAPHYFKVFANNIKDDMTEQDLENLFYELAHEAMLDTLSVMGDPSDFIAWAKTVQKDRDA